MDFDVIIIGGGIVGLSTAMQLLDQSPSLSISVLEKEADIAQHQTSHNSGVIHAGVYYQPGSLKAQFCKAGVEATLRFCQKHNLPYEQCGKLIVATNELEVSRLDDLYKRCLENGLNPERLDKTSLGHREPRIVGEEAIYVSSSGITDYALIAEAMARDFRAKGGIVLTNQKVLTLKEETEQVIIESDEKTFECRYAIVCAGLMADRLARMCGLDLDFQIVPFRGEYYKLPTSKNDIVNHLIYPVS